MAKRGGFPGGMGMPGNMNNLMKQAQRMQRQMEEAQKELEEKEKAARELEERKHTPGYCRYCGSEHAEYIPFEGEWMCEDCYYDIHY